MAGRGEVTAGAGAGGGSPSDLSGPSIVYEPVSTLSGGLNEGFIPDQRPQSAPVTSAGVYPEDKRRPSSAPAQLFSTYECLLFGSRSGSPHLDGHSVG